MKIKLYNDVVFKWIFGRQEYTTALISLLNAVLDEPGKFSEVRLLNPFDVNEPFSDEKQGILDIRGKERISGEWFDLEVQVLDRGHYPERSKYYLAGLYRNQLEKNSSTNYYKLRPCHGIHILVDTIFSEPADAHWWYNHYAMRNIRSGAPLVDHWHLHYVELKKYMQCLSGGQKPATALEQWSYYLGTIQDNGQPLDEKLQDNASIKEVHAMLSTFTRDEHLREKYRLHEEYLRVQRTEKAQFEKARAERMAALMGQRRERKQKEAALKALAAERAEKEVARAEKEAALQAQEALKRKSIRFMRAKGSSDEEIAQALNLELDDVVRVEG